MRTGGAPDISAVPGCFFPGLRDFAYEYLRPFKNRLLDRFPS